MKIINIFFTLMFIPSFVFASCTTDPISGDQTCDCGTNAVCIIPSAATLSSREAAQAILDAANAAAAALAAAQCSGTVTLSNGSVTVSSTKITSSNKVNLDNQGGDVTNIGFQYVGTRVSGKSFVIQSNNPLDASMVAWSINNC